jgi:hypothetical protein
MRGALRSLELVRLLMFVKPVRENLQTPVIDIAANLGSALVVHRTPLCLTEFEPCKNLALCTKKTQMSPPFPRALIARC